MAYGEGPADEALRDAWLGFCDRLRDAGMEMFKDVNPPSGVHRVDGLRFLTQNLGQAFDLALETRNTRYPVIHAFCTPFCKLGADNADFAYQQAWIDGRSVYRISGNRGTCRFLNFAVHGTRPELVAGHRGLHDPFGDTPEANLFGHDMEVAWDGSFELYIGGEERGPNWLPTTPSSRKLFIRQGFDDWSELPAHFRIERVDMAEPRPMPMPEEMVAAVDWAGTFLLQLMRDWPEYTYDFSEDVHPDLINRFPDERRDLGDTIYNPELDKKRGRSVASMCWQLAPDEALIVEWDANDLFWMMTNMGLFMNSMDYLYRPVSYSPSRTKVDSDGKIRMILAHSDPGFHNWIDTQGFERGHLCNRNLLTSAATQFRSRLVKHVELADHLPADTARITPEQRAHQLRERFHSILRRFNL